MYKQAYFRAKSVGYVMSAGAQVASSSHLPWCVEGCEVVVHNESHRKKNFRLLDRRRPSRPVIPCFEGILQDPCT